MKLPWDKQYLKISFHIVVTALAIYVVGLIIGNINLVKDVILQGLGTLLSVFAPLLVAIIFSFLMSPAVDFFQRLWEKCSLQKMGKEKKFSSRKMGTITTYIVIFLVLFALIRFLAVKIGSTDATALAEKVNMHIQDFTDMLVLLNVKLSEIGVLQTVEGSLMNVTKSISAFLQGAVNGLASSVTKAGGWALNLILGMTIGFYFLVEKEKILYYCNRVIDVFFSEKRSAWIKELGHDVNAVFSGYIGGQVTDAVIMATLISISFSVAKIPYAVLIGVISGFSNLIPYIGAVMALLLSVAVGLLSGTPIKALYAVIIVLVLQQVDSILIVPKVVGKSVELHPALVILSLAVFGGLFGILGMVVAVPCGALIKMFAVRYYEKRALEKGMDPRR